MHHRNPVTGEEDFYFPRWLQWRADVASDWKVFKVEWRIYDDSRSCLILDEYCYIADDPDKRHREFWTAVN